MRRRTIVVKAKKKPDEKEWRAQCHYFEWVEYQIGGMPELDLIYASANGGKRNRTVAAKMKRSGVRAGIPDVHFPFASGGYNSLYIELKIKPNTLSKSQKIWIAKLTAAGNLCLVAWSWEEMKQQTLDYLAGKYTTTQ